MELSDSGSGVATIPISVDSVKDIETYRMTRCTYFSIESSESAPGWTLSLGNIGIDFFLLGLSGIIMAPPADAPLFDTPDKIDALFEIIEANDTLYVDVNEIWLPNALFNMKGGPRRGDVFRIGYRLFNLAYKIKEQTHTDDQFLQRLREADVPLELDYSESETAALHAWNLLQIDLNRRHYHENPEANLAKKI